MSKRLAVCDLKFWDREFEVSSTPVQGEILGRSNTQAPKRNTQDQAAKCGQEAAVKPQRYQ